ncbi:MAG: hypothetical protein WC943_07315 [Elusimicrobiota bacterium]|jgi:hypothetical protein
MTHTFEIRGAADLLDAQTTAAALGRCLGMAPGEVCKILVAVAEAAQDLLAPGRSPALVTLDALTRNGSQGLSLTMVPPAGLAPNSRRPKKLTVWTTR